MNWKIIRLELAATEAHPRGSAGRALMLHVPVTNDGLIDRVAVDQHPGLATVRRFWGSEPDCFGRVEPRDQCWALTCGKTHGEVSTFLLEARPLKLGLQVKVRQSDGTELPFRIASVRPAGQPS
jgi:hypothetical protein